MLTGLRHIYVVAKEKLFREPPKAPADDRRAPHERFRELAAKIVKVPKPEIDRREKRWRDQHPDKGAS